ncbi:Sorting nexin-4 [Hondaea fermentalgiana]|uniref:Sorting nexin-4 n=1 Tax=Hondaea fermentalgiana TaxID=2315210 RepID=A0A2R5GE78_9STRA|nr:Sorting nexin-4 [Hondaea fermentalgiana]|eukprot:GBG26531.1 Sorting nexin-4 [Hondaea fermentalgiana]
MAGFVQNPDLGLDDWIRLSDEDPVLVSLGEPHKANRGFMKTSVLYTVRTSSKTESHSVARSYKDFEAFRRVLEARFPGASVPLLPEKQTLNNKSEQFVAKRMHQLEFFMQAISNNPFFRADDGYTQFVSSTSSFDRSLADHAFETAGSEGFYRWKQAIEETEVKDTNSLRTAVMKDLDMVRVQLRILRKAGAAQAERMMALAGSSVELFQSFADFYLVERDSVQFVSGPAQLAPASTLGPAREVTMADVLLDGAEKMSQFAAVQKSDIMSSRTFRAALVEPIQFEIDMVDMWKNHIDGISKKIKSVDVHTRLVTDLESKEKTLQSKMASDGDPKGRLASQLANVQQNNLPEARLKLDLAEKDLVDHERGLLGIELTRYRAARTLRMERIVRDLTRLHLRGFDELTKAFDGSGSQVRLGQTPKGHLVVVRNENASDGSAFSLYDEDGSSFGGSGSFMGETDAGSSVVGSQYTHSRRRTKFGFSRMASRRVKSPTENPEAVWSAALGDSHRDRSHQMSAAANMRDGTRLRVRQDYAATRSDELDVSRGEVLSARRVDDSMWYATNARGLAGLVPSSVVQVASGSMESSVEGVLLPSAQDRRRSKRPPEPPVMVSPEAPRAPPGLKESERERIDASSRAAARKSTSSRRSKSSSRRSKSSSRRSSKSSSRRSARDEENEELERELELERERERQLELEERELAEQAQTELDGEEENDDAEEEEARLAAQRQSKKKKEKSRKSKSRSKSRSRRSSKAQAKTSSENARPPAAILTDISTFKRSQLRHRDSQDDDSVGSHRRAPGMSALGQNPSPMEELMQKLAFREKAE